MFGIVRIPDIEGNSPLDRGAFDQIWHLYVLANDSEVAKIWSRPGKDMRIELDLLSSGLRDLDWLAELPWCEVDLCASGEILQEIRCWIVAGILYRQAHLSLDGASASQLVAQVTQIIARQFTLTIP